jgi:hypothetical protein
MLLSILAMLGLGACQPPLGDGADAALLGPPDGTASKGGTAMSFIGIDGDGCEMFQPVAKAGQAVVQALHYRTSTGDFSINKDEAHCAVEMQPAGVDADGCPIFRAVWPNGESAAAPYYRAGSGYLTSKGKAAICG